MRNRRVVHLLLQLLITLGSTSLSTAEESCDVLVQEDRLFFAATTESEANGLLSLSLSNSDFEAAKSLCNDRFATLARISSTEEFVAVQTMLESINGGFLQSPFTFWIGLEDTVSGDVIEDPKDTARFAFVDGSEEGLDFFKNATQFPWASDEPDSDNTPPGPQKCVAWVTRGSIGNEVHQWHDRDCSNGNGVICRKSCVTQSPPSTSTDAPVIDETPQSENEKDEIISFTMFAVLVTVGSLIIIAISLFLFREKLKMKEMSVKITKLQSELVADKSSTTIQQGRNQPGEDSQAILENGIQTRGVGLGTAIAQSRLKVRFPNQELDQSCAREVDENRGDENMDLPTGGGTQMMKTTAKKPKGTATFQVASSTDFPEDLSI